MLMSTRLPARKHQMVHHDTPLAEAEQVSRGIVRGEYGDVPRDNIVYTWKTANGLPSTTLPIWRTNSALGYRWVLGPDLKSCGLLVLQQQLANFRCISRLLCRKRSSRFPGCGRGGRQGRLITMCADL